ILTSTVVVVVVVAATAAAAACGGASHVAFALTVAPGASSACALCRVGTGEKPAECVNLPSQTLLGIEGFTFLIGWPLWTTSLAQNALVGVLALLAFASASGHASRGRRRLGSVSGTSLTGLHWLPEHALGVPN